MKSDMVTKICGKRILFPDGEREGALYIENGVIKAIDENIPYDEEISAGELRVLPGLIDLHTHGARGFDFAEADAQGMISAISFHLSHGATGVMPTITSSTYEKTAKALSCLEEVMKDKEMGACVLGAHLEGPYFSEKQCGAQDKSLLSPPKKEDYVRLVERFGHLIKRWDYAPELDFDGSFAAYLSARGILPSAAHTDAKYEDMCRARENGCKLVTHLYSCTSTITREKGFRILGVTECAYLWDDLYIEIIADGKHLPPELLRLIFKLKAHDKILLVSDSLRVAGSTEKFSSVGTTPCVIEDGVCKLLDRSAFAGSIATADRLLHTALDVGLPLPEAVKMGSENPAKLFGLKKGRFEKGYDADFIFMDDSFNVKQVFVKGEKRV